jgi:hypothetical protein
MTSNLFKLLGILGQFKVKKFHGVFKHGGACAGYDVSEKRY